MLDSASHAVGPALLIFSVPFADTTIMRCLARSPWRLGWAALSICLALGGIAWAQHPGDLDLTSLTIEELAHVKLYSVSRHLEDPRKAPSAVTVITADEITRYGWRTLAEASLGSICHRRFRHRLLLPGLSAQHAFRSHEDRPFVRAGSRRQSGNPGHVPGSGESAHNIGMRVTVEGVEDAQQLALIRQFAADEAQGFLLGRPTADPGSQLLHSVQNERQAAEAVLAAAKPALRVPPAHRFFAPTPARDTNPSRPE